MRATKTLQINRGNTQYHDRFFAVREYDWAVVLPWSDARNNYDNYITVDGMKSVGLRCSDLSKYHNV